ncbi:melibiose operon regulatory protein [Klebsiella pneumoniae]|nr:melibiose operon regulatory protein [Klebsiella pneumoniae]
MLEFIAAHYDQALTVNAVAEHVKLNPNYAMGVFQRVMQQDHEAVHYRPCVSIMCGRC